MAVDPMTHNICIQNKQKMLTKTFLMILNWKKTWFIQNDSVLYGLMV